MPEEEIVEPTEEVAEEEVEEIQEVQEEAPAEEEAVEEVVEEVVKPKQTAQERINEITRKRREAERDAEYWRAKALEGKKPEPEKKPTSNLPARPTTDQFETAEQYEDALFEWRDRIVESKRTAEQTEREYQEQLSTFNQRAKELRRAHDDFDEVIESPVFTPNMRLAILSSEKGPEMAYHLGLPENIDAAERIRALPDNVQLYEMGKLEARLSIAKKTKKVTTAPDPIKPVGISGKGEVDPSKLPIDEWMKWNEAHEKAKIKARLEGA